MFYFKTEESFDDRMINGNCNSFLFSSKSDRNEFASNLVIFTNTVISFYKHCTNSRILIEGKCIKQNIYNVITTKELIISLLPNSSCRYNAFSMIDRVCVSNNKIHLISSFKEALIDTRIASNIINNILAKYYFPAIEEVSHFLNEVYTENQSKISNNKEELIGENLNLNNRIGAEYLARRDLDHLKKENNF